MHDSLDPTGPRPTAPPDAPAAPAPAAPEIDATLARLERSSREVQNYLDTIEQKIARLEPHVERLHQTTTAPSVPAPTDPAPDEAAAAALPDPDPAALPHAAPEASDPHGNLRRRRTDHGPRSWRPLHTSAAPAAGRAPGIHRPTPSPARSRLWLLLPLALVFVIGAVLWIVRAHRPSSAAQLATSANVGPQPSTTDPLSAKPSAGAAGSLAPQSAGAYVPPSVTEDTSGTSAPPPDNALTDEPTSPTEPTSATTAPDAADPSSAHAGSSSANRSSLPSGVTPIAPGKVRVSSGVMAGNLLYSRAPEQPGGLARLFHVQGRVTMQVVISPIGRVQNIRVLSGHHLLRGPARDAVSTWRYRPLFVNGSPVEVATIVSIDFRR